MTRPRGLAAHARILAPIAVVGLIAAHLLAFGFVTRHFALPLAAFVAVLALALITHLGVFASLAAWLRGRRG